MTSLRQRHISFWIATGRQSAPRNDGQKTKWKTATALIRNSDPLTVFRFAKPPLPQGGRERLRPRPRQRQKLYQFLDCHGRQSALAMTTNDQRPTTTTTTNRKTALTRNSDPSPYPLPQGERERPRQRQRQKGKQQRHLNT
jgi:hypothetical protein